MTHALRTNDGDIWPGDIVLVDGYSLGERLIEDTLWVVKVVEGKLIFSHIHEGSRSYVENLANSERISLWGQQAVEFMLNDGDGLSEDQETDLHWGDA